MLSTGLYTEAVDNFEPQTKGNPMHKLESELAYYTKQMATLQAEQDAFDDWLGQPRTNLAYAKAMERAQARSAPTRSWPEQLAELRRRLDLRAYAKAIGAPA